MLLSAYRPVYSQLVDLLAIEILDGTWKEGGAMPEVDEMAKRAGLNPQAVSKAYIELGELGALSLRDDGKRIVAPGAIGHLQKRLRERFMQDELPQLAARLRLLGLDPQKLDWGTDKDGS